MTDHNLPAYLQNRAIQDFTDYASDGLGSALPPHVSIRGNKFTLIDAAGEEYQPLDTLDCVIIDRSNFACKMYYDKPWTPNWDEPPACWSTNGVGPSRDAAQPQARTCAECQFNVRGSAVSKISGASIKACRDEYHMAILLPSIPDMMFRYVLTPGSFDNWSAYTARFKNTNVRISMVVTRMTFAPKTNGEVVFAPAGVYVDEATNKRVEAALREKATDVLCGRLDSPRTAAIAAPAQAQSPNAQIPFEQGNLAPGVAPPNTTSTIPQGSLTSPNPSGTLTIPNTAAPGGIAPTASPSDPAPAQRRRRRTAAEMQEAQSGPANGQAAPAPAAAPQAPFPHPRQTAAAAPNASGGNFGIAQPGAASPELAGMLDDFFSKG